MITEFDALVRNLGLTEPNWLLYNLDKLSKDYPEAKELLKKLKGLQSKQSQMRKGLSLEEFKQELNFHHIWIGFTLSYCVIFMKTLYGEDPEDASVEEYEYLYEKYNSSYDKFIKDIAYVVDNVDNFAKKYNSNKREQEKKSKIKHVEHKELPALPKFPPILEL